MGWTCSGHDFGNLITSGKMNYEMCTEYAEANGGTHIFFQDKDLTSRDFDYCHIYVTCDEPYRRPATDGVNYKLSKCSSKNLCFFYLFHSTQ